MSGPYAAQVTVTVDTGTTFITAIIINPDGSEFSSWTAKHPNAPAKAGDVDVAAFIKDVVTRMGYSMNTLGHTPKVLDNGFRVEGLDYADVHAFEGILTRGSAKMLDLGVAVAKEKKVKLRDDLHKIEKHWK